jgi:hypothetical protein
MRTFRLISSALLSVGLSLSIAPANAFADTFYNTYLGPGVQASSSSSFSESFNNGFSGTTNYNGSSITGTYSGAYSIMNADMFGGAGGTGQYITTSSSYTLTLSSQVNYFGMWFSALDSGNQLSFYDGSTLVFSFSPSDYAALVGACPTSAAQPNYCGNPNSNFYNQDSGQQYAFLNFYDTDGTFNKVVFTENPQVGGFESDNHTVANISSDPGGTPLNPVPEPSTFVMALSGLAGLAGFRQRVMARIRG